MKLRRLDLLAFGSLRDVTLELDAVEPCLNVVYGPNEAGKSTALRALTGLFYGIAANTKDAHTIDPDKLRVGAELCDAAGRTLQVVRRKGRKDTLLAHDGRPLAAAEAAWITGGIAESTFHSLFGLSFESLHSGAEELLGSSGDLGQSLFSAAFGGGRVRRVLEQLEDEAAALWKRRGQLQQLNAALKLYEAAKRKSRDDGVKSATILEQQAAKERAQAECERLSAELQALRAQRAELERARRVLPLLTKQRALQDERRELGDVPLLSSDAPRERRQAEAARRDAQLRLETAQAEQQRLERELGELQADVQQALTEVPASRIEALRDRLSGYRRSVRALPAKREAWQRAQAEVERVQKQLQLPDFEAFGSIERLRLPKPLEARAREMLRAGMQLRARLSELRRAAADKRDQLERLQQKFWQLWGLVPEAPLLARAALPSEAACAEFEQAAAELNQQQLLLERKRAETDEQLERNRRERDALRGEGAPPSEAELIELRTTRDATWARLRQWLEAPAPGAQGVGLFEQAAQLSEQADAVADRLWREAGRVSAAAKLSAEHASLERTLAKLASEQRELDARREHRARAWSAHFQSAGLPERSLRETRSLLHAQTALLLQSEEVERELAAIERDVVAESEAERQWTQAWQALTGQLGLDASTGAAELEALLEARSELLTRHDAASKLADEVQALERELEEFGAQTARLCSQHLPELAGAEPELAAERLIETHRKTHAALSRVQQLRARLSEQQRTAQAAQLQLTAAERSLATLMQAANVTDLPALEAAELRSARAQEVLAEQHALLRELAVASDGHDPEAVANAVACSLDELRARVLELDEKVEQLDEQRQRATHEVARCEEGLAVVHRNHAAGDAAAEAAAHLEQVRALTQRYVRVQLASNVLKREIERYRERHRAPVLQVAAEMFQRLTLGAYSGLDVEYGADDEPVLVCVRADDKHVSVPALSTGTRDQLYLALRLASIEHLSAHKEPMPLILDDILVHFDDERARAALSLLADFAATTQVLFFTHHRRLCELATGAIAPERVRVQQLPYTRPAATLAVLRA